MGETPGPGPLCLTEDGCREAGPGLGPGTGGMGPL